MVRPKKSKYHFDRFGSSLHVRIENGAELRAAMKLDPALWVATSMPTKGVAADPSLLTYLDSDASGRITHSEVLQAVDWMFQLIRDDALIHLRSDLLDASYLNGGTDAIGFRDIFARVAPTGSISLDELRKKKSDAKNRPVSDAGVVLPEASDNPVVRRCIALAIEVSGGVLHPSGARGLDEASLECFIGAASKHEVLEGAENFELFQRFKRIIEKIDEFFALSAAVSFVNASPGAGVDSESDLSRLPLAKPTSEGILRFGEFYNPEFAEDLSEFHGSVLAAHEIDSELTAAEWNDIRRGFRAAESLDHSSMGDGVHQAFVAAGDTHELLAPPIISSIRRVIATETKSSLSLEEVSSAEKLLLYRKYLLDLANNFISFPVPHTNRCMIFGKGRSPRQW